MEQRRARIERYYDDRAARYHNPVTDFMGERELRVIRPFVPEGAHVLDYGCGSGRTTIDHLRRGCSVTAFDVSREMLALARVRAGDLAERAEFTAEEHELAGRLWPVVTCIGVLDYYPAPARLLATLRGHAQAGGRVVLTWPNAHSPLGQAYRVGSALFTFAAHPRSASFVRAACEEAGLRVDGVRYAAPRLRGLAHTLVVATTRLD